MNKKILFVTTVVCISSYAGSIFSMEKSSLAERIYDCEACAEKVHETVDKYLDLACTIFRCHVSESTKEERCNLNQQRMNTMYDIDNEIGRLLDEKAVVEALSREANNTIYSIQNNKLFFYSQEPLFHALLQKIVTIYTLSIKQLIAIKNFLAEPIQSSQVLHPNSDHLPDRINHWQTTSSRKWLQKQCYIINLLETKQRSSIAYIYLNQMKQILMEAYKLLIEDYETIYNNPKHFAPDKQCLASKMTEFLLTLHQLENIKQKIHPRPEHPQDVQPLGVSWAK